MLAQYEEAETFVLVQGLVKVESVSTEVVVLSPLGKSGVTLRFTAEDASQRKLKLLWYKCTLPEPKKRKSADADRSGKAASGKAKGRAAPETTGAPESTDLCCDTCDAWFTVEMTKQEADAPEEWHCGVCLGTHVAVD